MEQTRQGDISGKVLPSGERGANDLEVQGDGSSSAQEAPNPGSLMSPKSPSSHSPSSVHISPSTLTSQSTNLAPSPQRALATPTPHIPSRPRTQSTPSNQKEKLDEATIRESITPAVTRDPVAVPNIQKGVKRRFQVPPAPDANTRFFRVTSKRPLEEGEIISDSEDDIDNEWILQKHDDTIDNFTDVTKEEKEFLKRFDRHMINENPSSDLHAAATLIRFCRSNRGWLQNKAMKLELDKKLACLRIQGCISLKTIRDCTKTLKEVVAKDEPDTTDIEAASSGLSYWDTISYCAKCHQAIPLQRKIPCADPDCKAHQYHIQCSKSLNHEPGWRCPARTKNIPWHSNSEGVFQDFPLSPDEQTALPIRESENKVNADGVDILVMGDDRLPPALSHRSDRSKVIKQRKLEKELETQG